MEKTYLSAEELERLLGPLRTPAARELPLWLPVVGRVYGDRDWSGTALVIENDVPAVWASSRHTERRFYLGGGYRLTDLQDVMRDFRDDVEVALLAERLERLPRS